ncbi:hypothetical protein ACFX2F_046830 [Malus domestica]
MGIPDEERANDQNIDQHETSLNPDASTRSKRSGGRHIFQKGWKPDESLQEYAGRFSYEYSRCIEADDKTAFKAFTTGLRDCFFKYMINVNTWKTYSEVMAQAYDHTSAEARTYQGNPIWLTPINKWEVEVKFY